LSEKSFKGKHHNEYLRNANWSYSCIIVITLVLHMYTKFNRIARSLIQTYDYYPARPYQVVLPAVKRLWYILIMESRSCI